MAVTAVRAWPGRRGIRTRILAIAWIPSLLLLAGGIAASAVLTYQGMQIIRFTDRYNADTPGVSGFVMGLMTERRASVLYLADPTHGKSALLGARGELDGLSEAVLAAARGRAATDPEIYTQLVDDVSRTLDELPTMRQRVDSRQAGLSEAEDFYSEAVEAVAISLHIIAAAEPVPRAAVALAGVVSLIRANNAYLQADELALAAAIGPGLTLGEYTRFVRALGGQQQLLDHFRLSLDTAGASALDALRANPAWLRLEAAHTAVLLRGAGRSAAGASAVPAPPVWNADSVTILKGFAGVAVAAAQRATSLSYDAAQVQIRRAVAVGSLLLILGAVVLVVTTRTSGRLIGRLHRLREETLLLSRERLPGIVARLRQGEQVDVAAEVSPLDLGTDEVGQVAHAFSQAQETAIAAAVGEAEARAGLRTVFLNIAHRSQGIVHRQLGLLDKAERSQEDPDQLALLFELDHLTTRARRNAENLIILGGGQAGRQWRNPVPLVQVVRGAISEARDYVRVSLATLPEVSIVGGAVADTIHVLAELVDNATSFSPPMSRVEVRGNAAGRGIILEVEDQGLGIEPERMEQLNDLLHRPPDFQAMALVDEPRLGVFVVAQLAARQGIRVTLTPSPAYGGTKAVVLIPTELTTTADPRSFAAVEAGPVEQPAPPVPVSSVPAAEASPVPPAAFAPAPTQLQAFPVPPPSTTAAEPARPQDPPRRRQVGDPGDLPQRPQAEGSAEAQEGRGGRPALPRRTRQAHLAPQLRNPAETKPLSAERPSADVDPDVARRRLAAFQSGTRRARASEPPSAR